jgi:DNA-3-methyladenine glycosylase II
MMTFTIKPKAPYNFQLVGDLFARFPTQCVDLYEDGIYKRALDLSGDPVLVQVRSSGTVDMPVLEITATPTPRDEGAPKKQITRMFQAETDLASFYKLAKKDNKFWTIVQELYGLKSPHTPSVFEALIIAITEQQIALPVALAIRKRLVEKYGKIVTVNGRKYFTFPTAETLAKARVADIREMKFSTKKAEYIVGVSSKVASGELDLEAMKTWEAGKVLETLTKIRGIGPWTVEYMMCRGMGKYEALPASDIALRASVTRYLGEKERVSEKIVRGLLEKFGKYKGQAAFYLIYAYALKKYNSR